MTMISFLRIAVCFVVLNLGVVGCNGKDSSGPIASHSASHSAAYTGDSSTTASAGSANRSSVSSTASAVSSRQSQYTSSSRRLSDVINAPDFLELGVQAIDNQGLATAFDKDNGVLFFGAVHGKRIESLSEHFGPDWVYDGEQRLFDLTLSDDNQLLFAIFEYEINVFFADTGEILHTVPTPGGPAKELLTDSYYFHVSEEDGTRTFRVVRRSAGAVVSEQYETQFEDPLTNLQAGASDMALWAQQRRDDQNIYTACMRSPEALLCDEQLQYRVAEPEGDFIVSPNNDWLITQHNTLLPLDSGMAAYRLDGRENHPGYAAMDFNDAGALGVIDALGDAYVYTSISANAQAIPLIPKNRAVEFHLEDIITLDAGVYAIAKTEPLNHYWFITLTQQLFDTGEQ